jgi:hypothetical protein
MEPFDLLFLISPGIAVIFFYDYTLFVSIDWIKLILLSLAIITPLTMINTTIMLSFEQKDEKTAEKSELFGAFSMGTMASGIILYICLLPSYFYGKSLKEVVVFICVVEFGMIAVAYFLERRRKAKK